MSVKPLTALAGLALLFPVTAGAQQDKETVYRKVSAEVLEDVLRDLDVRYKKTADKNGVVLYDFERNNFKIRLSNFGGLDLMLDAAFGPVSADKINGWNVRAKFSRGVLYPGGDKPYVAVECNLDCVGGVTAGAIKQFMRRFDAEVKAFDGFLGDDGGGPAPPAPGKALEETVFASVSSELVEKVLKALNITYKKTTLNDGAALYDFDRNKVHVRLLNFGGKDLMLAAEFRKTTLQEANDFNLKRRFIRAVLYNGGGREYTALERNLDAEGGVTEGILRNFIASYDADLREFDQFLNTGREPAKKEKAPARDKSDP